ncbi:MAG: hypothetical protein D6729_06480 [Deltaproteobacteria bacterium]|nr:MAG: hypothetical protein D6729_06480 [Deltaproteobacteria bacterium]
MIWYQGPVCALSRSALLATLLLAGPFAGACRPAGDTTDAGAEAMPAHSGGAGPTSPAPASAAAAAKSTRAPPSTTPSDPLHRVWQRTKTQHAAFTALANNRGAYAQDLEQKYPKIWEGLGIDRRIPRGYDAARLRAALSRVARRVGLSLERFSARPHRPRAAGARRVPPHLRPDEPFEWRDDEILGEVEVTAVLVPYDLEKLERFFAARLAADGPLFLLERIAPAAKGAKRGAEVTLTAFYFIEDPPRPDRSIERFALPKEVQRAGDDPRALEIRRLHAELTQRLPEINEALRLREESALMDARYRLFTKTLQRAQAQRWSEVLGRR